MCVPCLFHSCMCHISFMRVPWFIYSYVCHDSFIRMCAMTHSFVRVSCLIHVIAISKSNVYVSCLIHVRAMTHPFIHVPCRISFVCPSSHPYVCRVKFMSAPWFCHTCSACHKWDMTYSYMWHDSFVRSTWVITQCLATLYSPNIKNPSNVWRDIIPVRYDSSIHATCRHNSSTCATWLIRTCAMTLYKVPCNSLLPQHQESFRCVTWRNPCLPRLLNIYKTPP